MSEAIDLITLRVIVTAADAGSISAAGDRMGLAVAAASARVSQLEEALGFRVFERSSRGVQLTPAGHMLAQRARELLASAERLALDLHDYSRGLQGQVRMLANASALIEVLPGLLDAFLRAHPAIRIVLEERSSSEIPLAVLEGRADLGVVDIMRRRASPCMLFSATHWCCACRPAIAWPRPDVWPWPTRSTRTSLP